MPEDSTSQASGRVTISIGVASIWPGDDAASLLRRADKALYRAKNVGRNRVDAG